MNVLEKIIIPALLLARWQEFADKNIGRIPHYLLRYDPDHDYVGPEGAARWVPNTIYGILINYAGFWHDRLYHVGGNAAARLAADLLFLSIILQLIFHGLKARLVWLLPLIACRVIFYFGCVRLFGRCFNFHKTKPQQTKPKDEK